MAPSPIEARAGGPPAEIRLRRGVIETITVLDPRGEPLAGAFVASLLLRDGSADPLESIAAKAAGITLSGTTAADGTIRLGPLDPDRPRRLAVRPPDGPVELRSTALEPWTPRNETVRLERGSFVRGVVQDKKGVPVAHAKVSATVSGSPAVDTYADATGAFEHRELPPGDVRLVAFLPVREVYGESEPAGPELVVATGRDDVVLVVDHGAELAVRVENLPASAEALEAMLIPDGEAASKRYHPSRLEGGRLRFSGLRGDTRYSLFIGPCPEAPDNSLWLTAVRGDAGEMTVRLVPGRTVRGRLVAPPGSDWLGVEVAMGPAALRGFEHEVGDGGRFEIRGVPVGPARIQGFAQDAEGRPLSGEATTSGDEVEVTLTPTKSHTMLR